MSSQQLLWIHGFEGRMGKTIRQAAEARKDVRVIGGSGQTQLHLCEEQQTRITAFTHNSFAKALECLPTVLDFSSATGSHSLCQRLTQSQQKNLKVVVATTGLSEACIQDWTDYAEKFNSAVLLAPNTSLGVYLSLKLAEQAAAILRPFDFDIEILETHHRHKQDLPSGTAYLLANALAEQEHLQLQSPRSKARSDKEIGISSLRGGSVFGEHEIRMMGELEEISISHRALSRELFAHGAFKLAKWIQQAPSSKLYHLTDIPIEDMK